MEDNIWTCSSKLRGFPDGVRCAMSATWLQRGCVSLLNCSRRAAASLSVGRASSPAIGPSSICRVICSRHLVLLPMAAGSRNPSALRTRMHGALPAWFVRSRRDGSSRPSNFFEKENIWTVPNVLSLARIVAAPGLYFLVVHHYYMSALTIFVLAGISDMVDGYIARAFPAQASSFGTVLDPLADKLLVCLLFLALTSSGHIPLLLTAVVLGRDTLLVLGGFYLRFTTLPPPRTWSRYWDIQRSTLQMTPSPISKVNTALQLATVALTLGSAVFGYEHHSLLQCLWCVTGLTTIVSGAHYITSREGFRMLKPKGK